MNGTIYFLKSSCIYTSWCASNATLCCQVELQQENWVLPHSYSLCLYIALTVGLLWVNLYRIAVPWKWFKIYISMMIHEAPEFTPQCNLLLVQSSWLYNHTCLSRMIDELNNISVLLWFTVATLSIVIYWYLCIELIITFLCLCLVFASWI